MVHDGPVTTRTYEDRCPGVLRPWLADDGAIVRLRIPGGRVSAATLQRLVGIAESYGDGAVLLTKRANLQVRGIEVAGGAVPPAMTEELEMIGLLPSRSHELVRNIVASPLTGIDGGRADLRPVVAALESAILADPTLATLGGRFLFVLDDGRGDVAGRDLDLGLVAIDGMRAQLRAGTEHWGPIVPVADAPGALVELARRFQLARGEGATRWWHVDELPAPLVDTARDAATCVSSQPIAPGAYDGFDVIAIADGLLTREVAATLAGEVVVTPWRSIVVRP